MSALIYVVLVLIIVGVVLWLINSFLPMASSIKTILNIVVVIVVIMWLLSFFGIFHLHSG
ncbi:MAG: Thivi_2564 family membrane protein [Acidithiobacillus ferrivorans]